MNVIDAKGKKYKFPFCHEHMMVHNNNNYTILTLRKSLGIYFHIVPVYKVYLEKIKMYVDIFGFMAYIHIMTHFYIA